MTRLALAVASLTLLVSTLASAESDDPMHVHSNEHLLKHMQDAHLGDGADLGLGSSRPEQQEYYYFKMHDMDNNNKLDGLELLKSLLDHQDIDSDQPARSDYQLEQTVEKILKDEDTNGDGYVDYYEFVAAQRRNSKT